MGSEQCSDTIAFTSNHLFDAGPSSSHGGGHLTHAASLAQWQTISRDALPMRSSCTRQIGSVYDRFKRNTMCKLQVEFPDASKAAYMSFSSQGPPS
eukprot:310179-Rhodomonas_salina.3